MNERIRELAEQAFFDEATSQLVSDKMYTFSDHKMQLFAELIVRDCQDNLAWHGHDEAVSQLDWFKAHKLGIK
jgi:hypothetical protein